MIDSIKLQIANRARELGFRFDDSELIDVVEGNRHVIFLRSIKAVRQVEQVDGTFVDEEFDDPIIWLNHPSPLLTQGQIDQERRVIHYSVYQPQLCVLYPELIRVLPR